jgi:transcriptional regulator with XRE-family HTH domain
MRETLSAMLRRAIQECGLTRYEISCRTGVDQAALSRFLGGGDLMLATADKLLDVLDIEVKTKGKHKPRG